MRKAQVLHITGEIADRDIAAEPWIEAALLGDAGHREAAVIMRRIEQAIVGQVEDLVVHRAIYRRRVALLEIRATAATDRQAIAGKGHAAVIQYIGQAAVGMPRGRANHKPPATEGYHIVLCQVAVGTRCATPRRQHDLAAQTPLEQPSTGHVIGMNMSFQRRDQAEVKLIDKGPITTDLLEHRIDQHRLTGALITQQIGVGR